jgi:hypothetical protein
VSVGRFMKNSELTKKFKEICTRHGIKIRRIKSGPNRANSKQKTVWIRQIVDSGDFTVALHEAGHVMCDPESPPHSPREQLGIEANAWQWALDQSSNDFDLAGWSRMHQSLIQYYDAVRDTSHPAHALLARAEEKDPSARPGVSNFGAPRLIRSVT